MRTKPLVVLIFLISEVLKKHKIKTLWNKEQLVYKKVDP